MLPLVTILQLVNCDGARYYSYSKNDCLSIAQCLDNDEFPYSLGRICVGIPPDTASGMRQDNHGAYMCSSDRYIIFNKTVARCVQSVAECPGFYVSEEKKACLNSSWICVWYAGQYGYINITGKYCVPWKDCVNKYNGYQSNYYDCLSAVQCEERGTHAYADMQKCWGVEPERDGGFDKAYLERGVYKCTDALLDISRGTARCIPRGTCAEYLRGENVCVTKWQCTALGTYTYVDGPVRKCFGTGSCLHEGGHVYAAFLECRKLGADTSEGFVARYNTENFYQCAENYSLLVGEVARCVPIETCPRFSGSKLVCLDSPACPSGLALGLDNVTCVVSCGKNLRYSAGAETRCAEACPSFAPYRSSDTCYPRCPPGSFLVPGSLSCASPPTVSPAWQRVSALPDLRFLLRLPRSYARLEALAGAPGRFSAFLEMPAPVAFLRLRALLGVPGASWTGALHWGGDVLGTELQLSGAGSGLLLGALERNVRVRGCILFASVGGWCRLAEGGYAVELVESRVDTGEAEE